MVTLHLFHHNSFLGQTRAACRMILFSFVTSGDNLNTGDMVRYLTHPVTHVCVYNFSQKINTWQDIQMSVFYDSLPPVEMVVRLSHMNTVRRFISFCNASYTKKVDSTHNLTVQVHWDKILKLSPLPPESVDRRSACHTWQLVHGAILDTNIHYILR